LSRQSRRGQLGLRLGDKIFSEEYFLGACDKFAAGAFKLNLGLTRGDFVSHVWIRSQFN
jgi:hypothetical protein